MGVKEEVVFEIDESDWDMLTKPQKALVKLIATAPVTIPERKIEILVELLIKSPGIRSILDCEDALEDLVYDFGRKPVLEQIKILAKRESNNMVSVYDPIFHIMLGVSASQLGFDPGNELAEREYQDHAEEYRSIYEGGFADNEFGWSAYDTDLDRMVSPKLRHYNRDYTLHPSKGRGSQVTVITNEDDIDDLMKELED